VLTALSLCRHQVQAYVARTDIDPDASVAWLETHDGEFIAPDSNELSELR
jgi:hypothetical protein